MDQQQAGAQRGKVGGQEAVNIVTTITSLHILMTAWFWYWADEMNVFLILHLTTDKSC